MLSGFELYSRWVSLKRRATAVLKSNLIRSIEFGTAVARRLKRPKTQSQTSKTSESTASLSLVERWTVTEIRRQSNYSVLAYSLLTDFLPRERELIKRPFNF